MQDDPLDKIIQRAAESLYEDESLRSNMSDSEANIVLQWATDWIESKLHSVSVNVEANQVKQDELARVKSAIKSFNALAAREGDLRLADAISAFESPLRVQSFDRDEVFKLLTTLTTAVWKMRDEQAQLQANDSRDPNAPIPI